MRSGKVNRFKDSGFSRIITALVMFCLLATPTLYMAADVHAQSHTAEIILGEVDKSEFPEISLDFSIRNASPSQLEPLKTGQVSILEGDEVLPITRLESEYTGTHFMLAINPARNLAMRDPLGVSNYEKLMRSIKTLGSNLAPESGDHFSLFINPDSEWNELSNYSEWLTALESYDDIYGMRRLEQSFASLEMAINAYQNSQLEQDTVLLYIAPFIYQAYIETFIEQIERATQLGLPVHTWMVLEYPNTSTPYDASLREALEAGGGSLFYFSRDEDLPDPKSYLEGMGYRYTASYETSLRASQTVKLAVQLDTPSLGKLQSASKKLSVVVEPALLRFLNLVTQLPIELNKNGAPSPKELPLEVSIEFTDNFPREIIATSLWVNGKQVQENQAPPYGNFLIELEPYTESASLNVEVKLDDGWGIQGSTGTQEIALEISKPEDFLQEVSTGSNLWLILGAGIGILILGFVIFFPGLSKKRLAKASAKASPASDIKTEEGQTEPEKSSAQTQNEGSGIDSKQAQDKADASDKIVEEIISATQQETPTVPAYHFGSLHKLDKDSTPSAVKPFLLSKKVIYIGRDPKLADLVLDDPAIEPLHAELQFSDSGQATLTDFKSTAGTYRNFKAITETATPIQHGDILNFGTQMYRFHSSTRTRSGSI